MNTAGCELIVNHNALYALINSNMSVNLINVQEMRKK